MESIERAPCSQFWPKGLLRQLALVAWEAVLRIAMGMVSSAVKLHANFVTCVVNHNPMMDMLLDITRPPVMPRHGWPAHQRCGLNWGCGKPDILMLLAAPPLLAMHLHLLSAGKAGPGGLDRRSSPA